MATETAAEVSVPSFPKLSFESCDETSLKLKWDQSVLEPYFSDNRYVVKIQYKEPQETWEKPLEYVIGSRFMGEIQLKQADIVDLKPGTPYFVRLLVENKEDGSIIAGKETVFDTKPIDCTPSRKKKCVIS
jgi:hypothetical protein